MRTVDVVVGASSCFSGPIDILQRMLLMSTPTSFLSFRFLSDRAILVA